MYSCNDPSVLTFQRVCRKRQHLYAELKNTPSVWYCDMRVTQSWSLSLPPLRILVTHLPPSPECRVTGGRAHKFHAWITTQGCGSFPALHSHVSQRERGGMFTTRRACKKIMIQNITSCWTAACIIRGSRGGGRLEKWSLSWLMKLSARCEVKSRDVADGNSHRSLKSIYSRGKRD